MEYISYTDVKERFSDLLLSEESDGDLVRLSLDLPDETPTRVVFGEPAPEGEGDDEHVRRIERAKDALPPIIDGVLHRLHITEVGMIPVGNWRGVLDLASFELATDEHWNEFEAEASMHMNGRDPLMFRSDEYTILTKIVSAVLEHGESAELDLMLISLQTPFLMRIRQEGGITVWCANESIADEVAQVTGAHT
jgi:hypothetical protein